MSEAAAAKRDLVCFLYVLMRDEVVPGVVERLVVERVEKSRGAIHYSNTGLATYAKELADRIFGDAGSGVDAARAAGEER